MIGNHQKPVTASADQRVANTLGSVGMEGKLQSSKKIIDMF